MLNKIKYFNQNNGSHGIEISIKHYSFFFFFSEDITIYKLNTI
jgi:hypothetical protein